MSLSTYFLEYGRHVGQVRRRCCRRRHHRRAYVPTSNTASHDNHEKINSWVSFSFLYEHGAPLGGPLGRWSSANKYLLIFQVHIYWLFLEVDTWSQGLHVYRVRVKMCWLCPADSSMFATSGMKGVHFGRQHLPQPWLKIIPNWCQRTEQDLVDTMKASKQPNIITYL